MGFVLAQALTGLAGACSLFLLASGLSLIFGVTRVVNFAHGALAMLGGYVAYGITQALAGPWGFWAALPGAALAVAAVGVLVEMLVLRRIYHVPELFQLLATFGLTLVLEDVVVLAWGPDDLLGPRAPGLEGAVAVLGQPIPAYDLFLIGLAPLVLLGLHLLLRATRFGILLRAATQDRAMVAALGVDQRWLFTAVFALGALLAGLAGALQLPREAVNHTADLRLIVDAFVVVVIGGLGSVGGAFLAALLVSELDAFGILVLPGVSLVLIFAVMAAVLVLRPYGLLGRPPAAAPRPAQGGMRPWRPMGGGARGLVLAALAGLALLPLGAGPYLSSVGSEILIAAILAASLQFLTAVGGIVSFGHAAFFGLGAYGAALAAKGLGWPMEAALAAGVLLGGAGAALAGLFCVRLSGVYGAMLTLAFAQIAWSAAFQWTAVTGGDNGLLGLWPPAWASSPAAYYLLCLAAAAVAVGALRVLAFAPFGYGLRALRDAPVRAEALGLPRLRTQWLAFVAAGAVAALAGGLFTFLKGSVFPDVLGLSTSVDALVMVLLGGIGSVSGSVVGALVYKALSIWLLGQTDHSKLVLGLVIVALVLLLPEGLAGLLRWPVPGWARGEPRP